MNAPLDGIRFPQIARFDDLRDCLRHATYAASAVKHHSPSDIAVHLPARHLSMDFAFHLFRSLTGTLYHIIVNDRKADPPLPWGFQTGNLQRGKFPVFTPLTPEKKYAKIIM